MTHSVAVKYGAEFESRRRHRHRQGGKAARRLELISGNHDLLARRGADHDRRKRMRDRRQPRVADFFDLPPHADGVNFGRGRQRPDHDRYVVFAALAVDDVGEDEGAAFVLRYAADELPAHQGMQLGVLVDGCVDVLDETGGFEIGEMLLKIATRASAL